MSYAAVLLKVCFVKSVNFYSKDSVLLYILILFTAASRVVTIFSAANKSMFFMFLRELHEVKSGCENVKVLESVSVRVAYQLLFIRCVS